MTFRELIVEVQRLSRDELRELNKAIVAKLRTMSTEDQIETSHKFSIGDSVSWIHGGYHHYGKIVKCNQKTASVRETNAKLTKWSISWTCLTKEN